MSFYKIQKNFKLEKVKSRNKNKSTDQTYKNILNLNAGIYIATPIFLGLVFGYYLDIYFGKKPIFIVLFIIIGTFCSFYNLFKLIKDNS
jgi:F0F1-type ATP synthase assembly protein I